MYLSFRRRCHERRRFGIRGIRGIGMVGTTTTTGIGRKPPLCGRVTNCVERVVVVVVVLVV